MKDLEQEKKFNFCLQESLRVASNQPLLQVLIYQSYIFISILYFDGVNMAQGWWIILTVRKRDPEIQKCLLQLSFNSKIF